MAHKSGLGQNIGPSGGGLANFKEQSPSYAAFVNPDPYAGMGDWAGPGGGAYPGSGYSTVGMGGMGVGYNPDIVAAGAPSVNTGNEFGMGVPQFAPSQWGSFDIPTLNPTIGFNNQPYVENFNAGFPTQMNPAFNIDNIQQPAFAGYPNMSAAYPTGPFGNPNPFGSMFGGQGWTNQIGPEG